MKVFEFIGTGFCVGSTIVVIAGSEKTALAKAQAVYEGMEDHFGSRLNTEKTPLKLAKDPEPFNPPMVVYSDDGDQW